jgi:PAS domain S-box-containing protein
VHDRSEFKVDHRIVLPTNLTRFVNSQGELIRDEKGTPIKMMGTMIDITDRMKAEEAVRLSEEKYRTLFSTSPEAIVLIDLNGNILDCNDATEEISGLSKDQLIGVDFLDLEIFDNDAIPKMAEMFKELLETTDFKPLELELNIAGVKRWIEAYPELMKKNDEPYALLLIIRDITERKRSEKEISQRNEELSTLNTISGTINQTLELKEVLGVALEETISMLNVEGGLIYLTEKSKEKFTPAIYYGFSEDAMRSVSEFSMGEGISGQAAQLGVPLFVPNLAEDSQHISSAFFKDGWESLVSVPLKSKGDVVGVMTVSSKKSERFGPEDIGLLRAIGNQIGVAIENARLYGVTQEELSERKRAERKISEQNKFLKNVLESLTHPFYVVNVKNHLIEVANSAARNKGLSVGSSCHELSHRKIDPCGTDGFPCPIDEIIRTKQPVSTEHYHYDDSGNKRYLEIHAYPIFNEEGEVDRVIESTVDITDRKHAESDREILFRELEHRVKNNLQLLSSMVDMQILRSEDPALKLKLQEIQSVVDTIALIYTRAYEGSRLLGLNLNNFVEELFTALLKFKVNDELVILHSISGDNVKLNTDSAIPMALVANELIFNAVKHAFNGRSKGRISVTLEDDENEITMTIADDGIGISSDTVLDKPDSFGLKIVKNLVGQLNGTIDWTVENGTIFKIKIPVQKEEE